MHSKLFSWRQNNSRSYFAKIIPVIIHSPQNLCRGKTQQSFTGDEDSHSFLLDWTRTGDRQSRSLRTMEKLVKMMQLQLQRQREEMQQQREKMQAQEQRFREQAERHAHMTAMLQLLAKTPQSGQVFPPATVSATPTFLPFDSTSELWKDYWSRFLSFTRAHAVPDDRQVQVFLTKQSLTVYKLLSNLAAQETPPREINDLTMEQIVAYMKVQFDPTCFVIRARFKFWTTMQRRPGEPFKSWLYAYIKQRPRAILLPLPTPWTKHYVRASFSQWTMKRFLRHFLRWRRTSSTLPLLSGLPSKTKTPPKLRRRRSTAKIRSGVGDCAETVSTTASASAPSQEGSVSWTATMLPL